MSRYLDPKSDVVFKKIFGQHPKLLKSFLNAVLPLPEDGLIESLTYLPGEQVPHIPGFKSTLVDVKCTDSRGRIFIVEMQIQWTKSFMQRLLFGASTAYVRQLEQGEAYDLLKPVYGLGLLGSTFDPTSDAWYHHYKLVNVQNTQRDIKDLQLVFIELPKFKATSVSHRKLQVLWLRFMSELDKKTKEVPLEWLEVPEIKQAVELSEMSAYNADELAAYDQYWHYVSTEKAMLHDKFEEGLAKGKVEGKAEGKAETIQQTLHAIELFAQGKTVEEVHAMTGLDRSILEALSAQKTD
ncbi:MAG: Rpn family recombination-promoting nuclease/putative transposase [Gammaproteobacteria bacterium]|nr:Rpn family recombination-promoting nuclease/putative transposase [Gammaproteobacteria bacterium]